MKFNLEKYSSQQEHLEFEVYLARAGEFKTYGKTDDGADFYWTPMRTRTLRFWM
jgi:hypothetical protein